MRTLVEEEEAHGICPVCWQYKSVQATVFQPSERCAADGSSKPVQHTTHWQRRACPWQNPPTSKMCSSEINFQNVNFNHFREVILQLFCTCSVLGNPTSLQEERPWRCLLLCLAVKVKVLPTSEDKTSSLTDEAKVAREACNQNALGQKNLKSRNTLCVHGQEAVAATCGRNSTRNGNSHKIARWSCKRQSNFSGLQLRAQVLTLRDCCVSFPTVTYPKAPLQLFGPLLFSCAFWGRRGCGHTWPQHELMGANRNVSLGDLGLQCCLWPQCVKSVWKMASKLCAGAAQILALRPKLIWVLPMSTLLKEHRFLRQCPTSPMTIVFWHVPPCSPWFQHLNQVTLCLQLLFRYMSPALFWNTCAEHPNLFQLGT